MDNVVKNNSRNYNLDLLRILASFMVIVIHVAAYLWYDVSYNSFSFKVYNFYDSIVRSAVPIFIMISGVFFLSSKKQENIEKIFRKNIFKLVVIYLIWSLIYSLYNIVIRNYSFSLKDIVVSLISGPFHFWYIPTIIGLYLISPVLSKITIHADKKTFKYFFLIFMLGCIVKTISNCSFLPYISYINMIISKLPIDIVCQFYSYFILGYFLYNYEISKKYEKRLYILGIVSIISCAILTYVISWYDNVNNPCFYNEFSVFTFFETIALFLFFKNKSFISEKVYSSKISSIASYTLGIYITHILVMYSLFDFNFIKITDFNPILSVPIISILVFIICLFIVYIFKKIKFIGKYLF